MAFDLQRNGDELCVFIEIERVLVMNKREFLKGGLRLGVAAGLAGAAVAESDAADRSVLRKIRGSLDATHFGVRPDTADDQSKAIQSLLDQASRDNKPIFFPSGNYVVSNIDLPSRTRMVGIPGASRLIYGGRGSFLNGSGCELVHMTGMVLDGANGVIADEYAGLVYLRAVKDVAIDQCGFIGSQQLGVSLAKCGGRVTRSSISGAAGFAGLYSVDATGLSITENTVSDCANGGILVHRWKAGDDNSIISGNRISRIAAKAGGTGQRGNGINLFRAGNVVVTGNHVSDCAFSAIRANSANNCQMSNNTCLRSGETALYAEFSFEGSVINGNIVDGAVTGISIANFNEGGRLAVCSNNLVRNLLMDGPYPDEGGFGTGIYVEADTSLTGNVVEGAPTYAIGLGFGAYLRDVVAANNVVRDSAVGFAVSVVEGVGHCTIANNVVSGAKKGAILGYRWNDIVTGELLNDGYQGSPKLVTSGNTLV